MKQELFSTLNLKAATAIAAFGIEKVTTCRVVRTDGKESTVFWFGSSGEGLPKTELIAYWMTKGASEVEKAEDELLAQLNPAQRALFYKAACRYLYCYAHSRDNLVSDIKNFPKMVEIRNGERVAHIPADATDETKRQIAAML
jgi:hypothetical protein